MRKIFSIEVASLNSETRLSKVDVQFLPCEGEGTPPDPLAFQQAVQV